MSQDREVTTPLSTSPFKSGLNDAVGLWVSSDGRVPIVTLLIRPAPHLGSHLLEPGFDFRCV